MNLTAGIDAGGTTFKLAVAEGAAEGTDGPRIVGEARVPTTTPEATVRAAADALRALAVEAGGTVARLGVGSFGPVDIDPGSPRYGTLLGTPKPGWADAPLLGMLTDALGVPGALDTDVNAALMAERRDGAAQAHAVAAYVTIGTGIGVAVSAHGRLAGAPGHLEMGHVPVVRAPGDDHPGRCPYHGDCLEGLCAAPALTDRFGPLEAVGADDPAWDVPAHYLAQLCLVIVLSHRTTRIVLGGGVMGAPGLLARVQARYDALMAGYVGPAGADLIMPAGLGGQAGVRGAVLVAACVGQNQIA